jgi:hypothetical protein
MVELSPDATASSAVVVVAIIVVAVSTAVAVVVGSRLSSHVDGVAIAEGMVKRV